MRVVCLWFRVTSQHTHEISAQQEERCNTVITVVLTVLNNETSPVMEKGGVGGGPGDALRGDGTSNLRLNNTVAKTLTMICAEVFLIKASMNRPLAPQKTQ